MKFEDINVGAFACIKQSQPDGSYCEIKKYKVLRKHHEGKHVLLSVPPTEGGYHRHYDGDEAFVSEEPSLWIDCNDIVAVTVKTQESVKIGDKVKITNPTAFFPGLDQKRIEELMFMEHEVIGVRDDDTIIIPMPKKDGGHCSYSSEYGRLISKFDFVKVENTVNKTEKTYQPKVGDFVEVITPGSFLGMKLEVVDPKYGGMLLLALPKNKGGYVHVDAGCKIQTISVSLRDIKPLDKSVEPKVGDKVKISNSSVIPPGIGNSSLYKEEFLSKEHEVIFVFDDSDVVIRVDKKDGGHTAFTHDPGWVIPRNKFIVVSTNPSSKPNSKMKKVRLKNPKLLPFFSSTPEEVKNGTFAVLDENYKNVYNSILIEVPQVYGGILRHDCEKPCFLTSKENVEFVEEDSEKMKKEPKYQVYDTVFLPKRFKDELPEEVFNSRRGDEFYEFSIAYRKANTTDVDYFISICEADGGKWEKSISRTGRWINEKFLLSREEMEAEKKKNQPTINQVIQEKLSEKEIAKMTTTSKPAENTSIAQYEKQMEEVTIFAGIAVPAIEFAKTCIRYAAHAGCKALGKSGEFVGHVMALVEEFLKDKKEIVDNACRWVLGFLAKNVHYLRKIPGIKDTNYLTFLESEQIQRFGIYAQASAKGDVIGELTARVFAWVQEWIFGTAVVASIKDAIASPDGFMRFMSETDAKMRVSLVEKIQHEQEAEREATAADEMKSAMVAPTVA